MTGTGFSADAIVLVKEIDDKNWEVKSPFTYTGERETFPIDIGATTDFASVPRIFVWFLPRYGRYTLAAIVHDYLWRYRASTGAMSYIDADGTFRRAMRELGVSFLKRWIMWAAVRWGALIKPGGWRGWWRESWRVILITALALPILLPPAVLVAIALGLFFLIELIAWVPLKLVHSVKSARGTTALKQVNRPSLDWRS